MDIWMVAVAAGAGYISKHFKKYKQDGGLSTPKPESSFGGSFNGKSDSPKLPPDKKCPFRRLSKRDSLRQDDSEVRNEVSQGVSTNLFDGEQGVLYGNQEGNYVFSASSLFPGFIGDDGGLGDVEGMGDLLHKPSTPRSRLLLRNRGNFGRAIKPLSSLESCLMAQLYTEHVEMKEYMSSSFVTSSKQLNLRPFLVTDGSKVISSAGGDVFIVQNNLVEKKLQTYFEENNGFSNDPLPPNIMSLDIKGKEKANIRMEGGRELNNTNTTTTIEHLNLSRGSTDASLLLCLGMSFGILSSYMAHRQEVEKLNRLLKQTENLVQDLEEELEMKDSLIMQELKSEDHTSQRMDGGSSNDGSHQSVSREHNCEHLTNINNKESVIQKVKDDSFSKIEAELEAELDMLEQNMTSSTLERRISNLVELDPDFEPDVAQGELRADMLDRQANSNQDETGSTATTHSANYAVSPRELSLRLHEVLQSQLEERIRELEAEIENRIHKSWKDFSSSDAGDENPVVDEPVVLQLSGEALDAYNEACNEFAKLDESDDEGAWSGDLLQHLDVDGPRKGGGGEKDFDEDEMEKLLIKHIVEKARQGSPVVLNAQRALFSE